jgi:hypothetical protein
MLTMSPDRRAQLTLGERIRADDSYGMLLTVIIVSLIGTALAGDHWPGRILTSLLLGLTLLYGLRTSRAGRRPYRVALVAVPATVVLGFVSGSDPHRTVLAGFVLVMNMLFVAAVVAAIVARLAGHLKVRMQTVLGALCIYLLLGMFFAFLFASIALFRGEPFFVQGAQNSIVHFLYFSFVTMSTVGYGDFTAASELGQMVAAMEAIIGQLYLVTVVALLVSNLGRERPAGPRREEERHPQD